MTDRLLGLLDAFRNLRVLVSGDSMLDRYIEGSCRRICPEGPALVVAVQSQQTAAGAAANVAMNVQALGAGVSFHSIVGNDSAGEELRARLRSSGIDDTHLVVEGGRQTLVKERILADSQLLLRLDQGSVGYLSSASEQQILQQVADSFPRSDAVIVSDYGYGVMTPNLIARLANLQARSPRVVVIDSKNLPTFREVHATAVKPNYEQAVQLLKKHRFRPSPPTPLPEGEGSMTGRAEQICEYGSEILAATGARIAAVTLDVDGAVIFEKDRPPYRTFASSATTARTSGAGDTFASALALAIAAGASAPEAADLASAAAAVVVRKDGTSICSADELRRQVQTDHKVAHDRNALKSQMEDYRRRGRRIVLTNGCFDILHRGHVTYLAEARKLGDLLVVGVNTDHTIRRLKGAGRPVNALEDRLHVLAALQCVDHLIAFDEETPHELIRAVRPHVFVKGGDYTRDRLPEAHLVEELGGRVQILPLVDNRSTTRLLTRMRANAFNDARRDARDDGPDDSELSPPAALSPPSEGHVPYSSRPSGGEGSGQPVLVQSETGATP